VRDGQTVLPRERRCLANDRYAGSRKRRGRRAGIGEHDLARCGIPGDSGRPTGKRDRGAESGEGRVEHSDQFDAGGREPQVDMRGQHARGGAPIIDEARGRVGGRRIDAQRGDGSRGHDDVAHGRPCGTRDQKFERRRLYAHKSVAWGGRGQ
jgi:hypothetical protein